MMFIMAFIFTYSHLEVATTACHTPATGLARELEYIICSHRLVTGAEAGPHNEDNHQLQGKGGPAHQLTTS